MKNIFITSAKRTAVGSLGKFLKNIPAPILSSEESLVTKNSNIKNNEIDEIILGQVLTGGAVKPARQAAIQSGIKEMPAYVVNRLKFRH